MKIKKILAAIAASAVAVSAMAVNAFAASEYEARICFADTSWSVSEMGDGASSVKITGDGQYTLETTAVAGASDLGVFCVDFIDMYAGNPDATATLDKIEIDGDNFVFAADKIIYGNIETDTGNYRIEIYNQYGETKNDSGVNNDTPVETSLKVTFTVSGLDAASADAGDAETSTDAPASDGETSAATTGNVPAAVMLSVMAVAGAAAVASRKKK